MLDKIKELSASINRNRVAATTYGAVDFRLAVPMGIGVGIWSGLSKGVLAQESSVLLAAAGAAIGILAVTLAAMALLLAFLDKSYLPLIRDAGGIHAFYRPFRTVSIVSGSAALACFAGAMVSGSGPSQLRAAFFALGMALLAWAIVGVIQLVKIFLDHGKQRDDWFSMREE